MDFVVGFERVTSVFGDWPTFHDAEVLAAEFETGQGRGVSLTVRLVTWESSSEKDERGFYRRDKPTEVTFLFEGCEEFEQEGFIGQNVLRILEIFRDDSAPSPISVMFEPIIGFGAAFRCRRASVLAAQPSTLP